MHTPSIRNLPKRQVTRQGWYHSEARTQISEIDLLAALLEALDLLILHAAVAIIE